MSTNESHYKKLVVEAYKVAFPYIKKEIRHYSQWAQKEWKQVKDSAEHYEKLMVSLRANRKSLQLQWWLRATSMKSTTCLLLSGNLITGFFTLCRQDWQNFNPNTR